MDHNNLEVFMSTKILNRRQVCWAEILADYDFVFEHIPGKINSVDGPSRCSDYAENASEIDSSMIFLKSTFRCFSIMAVWGRQHKSTKDLREWLVKRS